MTIFEPHPLNSNVFFIKEEFKENAHHCDTCFTAIYDRGRTLFLHTLDAFDVSLANGVTLVNFLAVSPKETLMITSTPFFYEILNGVLYAHN